MYDIFRFMANVGALALWVVILFGPQNAYGNKSLKHWMWFAIAAWVMLIGVFGVFALRDDHLAKNASAATHHETQSEGNGK